MTGFRAIRIDKDDHGQHAEYVVMRERDLMEGDVDVDIAFSAINYKDGLAVTGKGPVVRRFPMIPGVDLAGRVTRSAHPEFAAGDIVVATACGLGEAHYGGFAEKARLSGDWLTKLPPTLTPARAMAIGTAGLTAMFCVLALERHGARPEDGLAVVTGATGGVGSFAVALLAKAGWRVAAVTGRASEDAYLQRLGASEIISRDELSAPGKPLQKQRFAVGVDTVGGVTLVNLLAQTRFDGAVAACGNVGGMALPANVAPFILRGVALLGVESVRPRIALRRAAWARIAQDLDPSAIDAMSEIIPFDKALDRARSIVGGKIRGRAVIDMGLHLSLPDAG
ncbi:oxidoreductase [Methylocystis sp. L43]|jgi:acrylyl-CoA reductase (NADPH)|uniref:acrylyl-CoA reductase (NADPH) n=1 Tax=unclassified Methylocystis TaxID=2625913 RepID=UPI0018C256A2|nr:MULTISPECIES: MDR family oxidoreductase [unclassified Methylocystis]MBG0799268.1 oxidoreductase [Methylocystis sp. L43]MBG0807050.1 oxidoreductase [Methylocystis sp. H15]